MSATGSGGRDEAEDHVETRGADCTGRQELATPLGLSIIFHLLLITVLSTAEPLISRPGDHLHLEFFWLFEESGKGGTTSSTRAGNGRVLQVDTSKRGARNDPDAAASILPDGTAGAVAAAQLTRWQYAASTAEQESLDLIEAAMQAPAPVKAAEPATHLATPILHPASPVVIFSGAGPLAAPKRNERPAPQSDGTMHRQSSIAYAAAVKRPNTAATKADPPAPDSTKMDLPAMKAFRAAPPDTSTRDTKAEPAPVKVEQQAAPRLKPTAAVPAKATFAPEMAQNGNPAVAQKPEITKIRSGPDGQTGSGTREKGLMIPTIHGDLKMVVTGSGIRVTVAFRDYPKAIRERAVDRDEVPKAKNVAPIVAGTADGQEAVIEKSHEGVYTFSAAPGDKSPARATFTLKIFENRTTVRVILLGTRTLTDSAVLARVLMPEGILWNDEDAFTGSLEDSHSTTKFNAETGVYWKEFHD